jgi:hypothetical protein
MAAFRLRVAMSCVADSHSSVHQYLSKKMGLVRFWCRRAAFLNDSFDCVHYEGQVKATVCQEMAADLIQEQFAYVDWINKLKDCNEKEKLSKTDCVNCK